MGQKRPTLKIITLDGSNISQPIIIPSGTTRIYANPRTTTVTVQYAFSGDEANTTGKNGQLTNGQSLNLDVNAGDFFADGLTLSFFAGSAVVVDLVFY